jgi:hypothetical protein
VVGVGAEGERAVELVQPALADDLLHGAGGLLPKSASIQELFAEVSRSHRTLHFEIVPLDLRSLTRAKTLSSEAAGGFPQHLHLDAYACHQKVRGRR